MIAAAENDGNIWSAMFMVEISLEEDVSRSRRRREGMVPEQS